MIHLPDTLDNFDAVAGSYCGLLFGSTMRGEVITDPDELGDVDCETCLMLLPVGLFTLMSKR